jgi:hypothetical protein
VITLDPAQAVRQPLPAGAPEWVQIGPFEALKIERAGNQLLVDVEIAEDAPIGVLFDCHMEFAGTGVRRVYKANDVFRVTLEEQP